VVARTQLAVTPVIGYLGSLSADDDYKNFTVPFHQGLKEAGYVENQNVAVEYRWAENQYNRLPTLLYRFQSCLNRGVCGNLVPLGSEIL
jgi:putative ABC transport system substrate-binding protein